MIKAGRRGGSEAGKPKSPGAGKQENSFSVEKILIGNSYKRRFKPFAF